MRRQRRTPWGPTQSCAPSLLPCWWTQPAKKLADERLRALPAHQPWPRRAPHLRRPRHTHETGAPPGKHGGQAPACRPRGCCAGTGRAPRSCSPRSLRDSALCWPAGQHSTWVDAPPPGSRDAWHAVLEQPATSRSRVVWVRQQQRGTEGREDDKFTQPTQIACTFVVKFSSSCPPAACSPVGRPSSTPPWHPCEPPDSSRARRTPLRMVH